MPDFAWSPTSEFASATAVARFMTRHGIPDVETLLRKSVAEPDWFWDAAVRDLGIVFDRPYTRVRDISRGAAWTDWFVGGGLNVATNCLQRNLDLGRGDDCCLVGERESGTIVRYTYRELADAVARCAGGLRAVDVAPGDRVAAYMPMTVETVIQLLATMSIGAIFLPVFSGYAPDALAERLRDSGASVLFTADATMRRGRTVPIKGNADAAVADAPSVRHVIVCRYTDTDCAWHTERDHRWDTFLENAAPVPPVAMDAMAPAVMLYTSGTSGRPKGTVHSHAGALVQIAKEVGYAFDVHRGDRFFWLTDIGWMMGPWQIVGGLFHGATVVVYDGAFDWPGPDRLWEIVARHRVSVLGVSPTAVRLAIRHGEAHVRRHDLSALRILGSTGEPWDESSWRWYFDVVGGGRCPIINISGGTDIIGCFLSPLPIHRLKPCTLVGPGLGMAVDVWNDDGKPVRGEVGYLVCTAPAPSMTRGLWNDPERYLESYWSRWPGVWNHGDWALIDEDGYWFLHGRAAPPP